MKWGKMATAPRLRALLLTFALGAGLLPASGAFAAEANTSTETSSVESSLVVVSPVNPEEAAEPTDPQVRPRRDRA